MSYSNEQKRMLINIITTGECIKKNKCKEYWITVDMKGDNYDSYDVSCPLLGRYCRVTVSLLTEFMNTELIRVNNFKQVAYDLFKEEYGESELFDLFL